MQERKRGIVLGLLLLVIPCLTASECNDFEVDEDFEDFIFSFLDCQPNESQACYCDGGTEGIQFCVPDGGAWEACICEDQCTPSDEVCDNRDNDCDGQIDEGALDASTWYADRDSDGRGDPMDVWESCIAPTGYVDNDFDCDDTCSACWTGNIELCDGFDNDCNPSTPDGEDECPGACGSDNTCS